MMRKVLATAAAFAMLAPSALAASHFLKVSPSTMSVGTATPVRLYGSVGSGCAKGDQVILTSKAFKGATKHSFAGQPAVFTKVGKNHSFSVRVTIKGSIKQGNYHIGGRCGGGNFGSATLFVLGFY
jgi:hypothetical protein